MLRGARYGTAGDARPGPDRLVRARGRRGRRLEPVHGAATSVGAASVGAAPGHAPAHRPAQRPPTAGRGLNWYKPPGSVESGGWSWPAPPRARCWPSPTRTTQPDGRALAGRPGRDREYAHTDRQAHARALPDGVAGAARSPWRPRRCRSHGPLHPPPVRRAVPPRPADQRPHRLRHGHDRALTRGDARPGTRAARTERRTRRPFR
jgi:hypothetical protein